MDGFTAIMGAIVDKSCDGKSKQSRTGQRALYGGNGYGNRMLNMVPEPVRR